MARDTRPLLERSLRAFRANVVQAGPAATAGYTLIGAILVLGAAGYGLDAWLGSRPWGLIVGLALGIVVGFYELVKATWRR
jgi:F0F1-type ATP synthase assembly protein I